MCRYHVMGSCRNGASCPFSHDNARADSFVCPYFAKGHCAYGDKCVRRDQLHALATVVLYTAVLSSSKLYVELRHVQVHVRSPPAKCSSAAAQQAGRAPSASAHRHVCTGT